MSNFLEVLPPTGLQYDTAQVSQFDALKSGIAQGGNFERFQDASESGALPFTADGYGTFLQYSSDPSLQRKYPGFFGWLRAADGAYAVVNGMHQGNATSPVWTPDAWSRLMAEGIRNSGLYGGWTQAQLDTAVDSFNFNFRRLLVKFGYRGDLNYQTIPPQTLASPAPNTPLAPAPVEPEEIAFLAVTKSVPPASGDGIHFPVLAWARALRDPRTLVIQSRSEWVSYPGLVVNRTSSQTVVTLFIEDMTEPERQAVRDAAPGGPPNYSIIDTLASSDSTSFRPTTLPPNTVPSSPPILRPAQPSGSIPILDEPTITDIAVPPPSGGLVGVTPTRDTPPVVIPVADPDPGNTSLSSTGNTGTATPSSPLANGWPLFALGAVALFLALRKKGG